MRKNLMGLCFRGDAASGATIRPLSGRRGEDQVPLDKLAAGRREAVRRKKFTKRSCSEPREGRKEDERPSTRVKLSRRGVHNRGHRTNGVARS